jgi:hypothetical protein
VAFRPVLRNNIRGAKVVNEYEEAQAIMGELAERVELEEITLKVLSEELALIAEKIKDIERQVREL